MAREGQAADQRQRLRREPTNEVVTNHDHVQYHGKHHRH